MGGYGVGKEKLTELARCELCPEWLPPSVMTLIRVYDPNQKVISSNTKVHVMVCPDCLTKRYQMALAKGWKEPKDGKA